MRKRRSTPQYLPNRTAHIPSVTDGVGRKTDSKSASVRSWVAAALASIILWSLLVALPVDGSLAAEPTSELPVVEALREGNVDEAQELLSAAVAAGVEPIDPLTLAGGFSRFNPRYRGREPWRKTLYRAVEMMDRGDFREAASLLEKMAGTIEKSAFKELPKYRAWALLALGENVEAERLLVESNGGHGYCWWDCELAHAVALERLGRLNESAARLHQARLNAPNSPLIKYYLVRVDLRLGHTRYVRNLLEFVTAWLSWRPSEAEVAARSRPLKPGPIPGEVLLALTPETARKVLKRFGGHHRDTAGNVVFPHHLEHPTGIEELDRIGEKYLRVVASPLYPPHRHMELTYGWPWQIDEYGPSLRAFVRFGAEDEAIAAYGDLAGIVRWAHRNHVVKVFPDIRIPPLKIKPVEGTPPLSGPAADEDEPASNVEPSN